MTKKGIIVIGSSNTDMVVKADQLPLPGQTVLGGLFFMNPGGKGANQAVAAARLGGQVTFICKTGDDIFGKQSIKGFEDEGLDITYTLVDSVNPSGVALITVNGEGENCIVVASGANAALKAGDLLAAQPAIEKADILLLQLEIPIDTVAYAAQLGFSAGSRVILNPAPACMLPKTLFAHISIITPNQNEAEMLSGIKVSDVESAKKAAQAIQQMGVQSVVITLGAQGALVLHEGIFTSVPAKLVEAIDTTAAGDVFNGALCVALCEEKSLVEAVEFGCQASAIAVTRFGAQASAPYRKEIN